MKKRDGSLTEAQLRAELDRCIYCEEKPCRDACPADCSPADFIMAARVGAKSDLRRSAAMIQGGVSRLFLHEGVFAPVVRPADRDSGRAGGGDEKGR
jgi:hypothetical protein